MQRRAFDTIKNEPALEVENINLQKANGTYLKIDGYAKIYIRVDRQEAKHGFYMI